MAQDKTTIDNNRRSLSLLDTRSVKSVLPAYFLQEYPKIVSFLEAYYDYDQDSASPTRYLDDLFRTRDITEADIELLSYIEDELLLGQQYFEGFENKRAAAKYSNTLYRSRVPFIVFNNSSVHSLVSHQMLYIQKRMCLL